MIEYFPLRKAFTTDEVSPSNLLIDIYFLEEKDTNGI